MNVYYGPGDFGLETVGEIEWSSGSYEFDLTAVWRRVSDGRLVFAEDSGCSCPSPFEDTGVEDLRPIASLGEFAAHLAKRSTSTFDGDRTVEVAELPERCRRAGAR